MPRTTRRPLPFTAPMTHRVAALAATLLAVTWLVIASACSGDGSPPVAMADTGEADAVGADGLVTGDGLGGDGIAGDGEGGDGGGASCQGTPPAGHAALRFSVDDQARRTFQGGEMAWTGSFSLDEVTNVIVRATSWLPTDGPFPLLYDDGPRAACGHEPPDATAGDHVFTTEVWFLPDSSADTTFEYGLLNEDDGWMWVGPNGTLVVPAGSADAFVAEGLVIPPCGDADLELTLDLSQMGGGFEGAVTPWVGETRPSHDVYVKGTMNTWTDVLLVDNGKRGDAVARDGVYTFVLSENLGKHDCRLLAGDHPQFVFSITRAEQPVADGQEYKNEAGEAVADGVTARVDPTGDGAWEAAEVFLELASDGRRLNTTVAVPGTAPTCSSDGDCGGDKAHCVVGYCVACYEDAHCADGTCVKNRCEAGGPLPDCAADDDCPQGVCVGGACVQCRDASTCPAEWTCERGRCVEPAAPDCTGDGECLEGFCVEGRCAECRDDGDCAADERCRGGRCVLGGGSGDGPVLYQLTPASGPSTGGTEVTLKGLRFVEGMTVTFGDAAATSVTVTSAQLATCGTPPHAPGRADVVVTAPDGGRDTFFGGFYFYEAGEGPQVSAVQPDRGPTTGGSPVSIHGANFADGAQVRFGGSIASVRRISGELLQATTPASAEGPVDVVVTNPDGLSATCVGCYTFVELQLRGTPTVDGAIGADWPANHLVAENAVPSGWGAANVLEKLYVAFDDTWLYVGVVGTVETGNAIVGYVDADGNPATGIEGANLCWDDQTSGDVDDALCVSLPEQGAGEGAGSLWFGNASFGADFGFATHGMTSYDDPDCESLGDSLMAGWRRVGDLADPGDLSWLCGSVVTGAGAVEARIALDVLYPDGVPTGGTDIGLFVRIVSGEGNYLSNQALPSLLGSANVFEVAGVVRFRLD